MNIVEKKLKEIKPYEKNPRKNDEAVQYVMNSIKEFGFKVPIVIDKDGVIVCGHTRFKAAKKLKMKEVPCILADDLTPEQIKAFRLADNKTGEIATWDDELLSGELADLIDFDMGDFGFDLSLGNDDDSDDDEEETDNPYSKKINIPQYEPTGIHVTLQECMDNSKTDELIKEIELSSVSDEEKEFLKAAAQRHIVFNYRNIAEYYANDASKEMQELMEKSALVIIDLENAIANGYTALSTEIEKMIEEGKEESQNE